MNFKLRKGQVTAYLLFIFLILSVVSSDVAYGYRSYEAHVFGFPESVSLEMLLSYFDGKSGWNVVFHDLNDSITQEDFLEIVKIFTVVNIEVLPPRLCLSCEMKRFKFLTLEMILMTYASPLVGFFRDGRLTAVTLGITSYETLDQALNFDDSGVKVFTRYGVYDLEDNDVRARLEEFFLRTGKEQEVNALNLLPSLAVLAFTDSINPCTFTVFTALLFIALHFLGKVKAATTGFSFILAVFVGYYILGLGLYHILATIPRIDEALAIIGLVIGAFSVMRGLKPSFKPPVPKSFRQFIELRITRSYVSPVASFVLGLVSSLTLLPCSSGPYLVGLGLLSTLEESVQAYLLLILYNVIFVLPLLIILAAVLVSAGLSRKIKAFRNKKLGIMELASGALLIAVCAYILLSTMIRIP